MDQRHIYKDKDLKKLYRPKKKHKKNIKKKIYEIGEQVSIRGFKGDDIEIQFHS